MNARVTLAALLVAGCGAVAACGDDESEAAVDEVEATCALMATMEGEGDITVEKLDELLEVAPAAIEDQVQLVRDRLADDGEAAFDDPEVVAAFGAVGEFEQASCGEG